LTGACRWGPGEWTPGPINRDAHSQFGLERVGFFGIQRALLTFFLILVFSVLGVMGLMRLRVE
jgi:hypothetical protein